MVMSLVACALLLGLPAARAQDVLAAASAPPPPPGSALPPPGINDPGAKPQSVPLPSTGIPPSVAPAARQQAGGHGDSTNVTTQTNANGDTVEEYRRGGKVYMVRITPRHGVTQTYYYNSPNGNLMHDAQQGPVAPVYYDIYKWGTPHKAASGNGAAQSPSSSG